MKNLLIGIIAINFAFISLDTNAWEFKGIESGMTVEEVNAIIPSQLEKRDEEEIYLLTYAEVGKWLPSLKPLIDDMFFRFDHNGKLFYLLIEFDESKNTMETIGYEEAYKQVCDDVKVKTDDRGGVNCIFTDNALYNDNVKHYKEIRLEALAMHYFITK